MNVQPPLIADTQPAELVQPTQRPLHHPAHAPQAAFHSGAHAQRQAMLERLDELERSILHDGRSRCALSTVRELRREIRSGD